MEKLRILMLVRNWFKGITDQIASEQLLGMFSSLRYEIIFPEATLTDAQSFNKWYEEVKEAFFDQQHIIRQIEIDLHDDKAELALWVTWRGKTRNANHSRAQEMDFDAFQIWHVVKESGNWVIQNYKVVKLMNNKESNT